MEPRRLRYRGVDPFLRSVVPSRERQSTPTCSRKRNHISSYPTSDIPGLVSRWVPERSR